VFRPRPGHSVIIFQEIMMNKNEELLTLSEASQLATELLNRPVTPSNISYLIQYGQLKKYGDNGTLHVLRDDLLNYYSNKVINKEDKWKKQLGNDLNWALSFDSIPEKIRTKHVHRLHPYKGKFIPQLVEYFVDGHTDEFKREAYFKPGDILLDPFCGSGTTLVQAAELGIDSIGVDVSAFNAMISNVKVSKHNITAISSEISKITEKLQAFVEGKSYLSFETDLLEELNVFNSAFFPTPDYRFNVRQGGIDERSYSSLKEKEFLIIFENLVNKYDLQIISPGNYSGVFLDKWFNFPVLEEISFVYSQIKEVNDKDIKKVLAVILSRTMRSCRATTHNDLATLLEPMHTTYYCGKHYKICKPIYSILGWWLRYSTDTLKRIREFDTLRKDTYQHCFVGDSRLINLDTVIGRNNPNFFRKFSQERIKGIFSSPPYVGLIDYHEQHAYAYDLFKFERNDESEIGPLFRGQKKEAQESYVKGIADVLMNCRKWLTDDFDIFLVSNDKYGLYLRIARLANMEIVNIFKRPVLNRTEKDKTPYSEMIFHLKG
jgi:hypothetical protein